MKDLVMRPLRENFLNVKPICDKCNKEVDKMVADKNIQNDSIVFVVYCHNEKDYYEIDSIEMEKIFFSAKINSGRTFVSLLKE